MRELLFSALFLLVALLGYLQPFHSLPWPSALNDGIFLAWGLLLMGYAVIDKSALPIRLTKLEVFVMSAVVLHALVMALHLPTRSLYVYGLSLGIAFACYTARSASAIALPPLLAGITIAGVASALGGIGLWAGVVQQFESYQVWISHAAPGSAVGASLSQVNNAGTLFVWAGAIVICLSPTVAGSINPKLWREAFQGLMTAAIIVLAMASAFTLSRTASLNYLVLTGLVLLFRQQLGGRSVQLAVLQLVVHGVFVVSHGPLKELMHTWDGASLSATMFGGKGFFDGPRAVAYTLFSHAIAERPWFGWGVGGVGLAFLQSSAFGFPFNTYFGHTHNIILELAVWWGLPLSLLFVVLGLLGLKRRMVGASSPRDVCLLILLCTVLVHALLEYPLHYTYFLIPTAVILAPHRQGKGSVLVTRGLQACVVVVFSALFVVVARDYLSAEYALRQARLEASLFGKPRPPEARSLSTVKELENLNFTLRTQETSAMSSQDLRTFIDTTTLFPTRGLIDKTVNALELNDRPAEAELWRQRKRQIYVEP